MTEFPETWKVAPLGSVCRISSGATPKTGSPEYWGGEIPWVTPLDMSRNAGPYIDGGERTLTQVGLNSCSAKVIPAGSVVYSSRAPIGYAAIAAGDVTTNQGCKSATPPEYIDSKFLYYYLLWRTPEIKRRASGTTFLEISGKKFAETILAWPPLDEQRRIVAVLEDHLSRLDTASRSLRTSSKLANGLWASVVDRAFQSGESGAAAWPYVEVGSVAEFVRGVTYKKPEASSESGKDRVALLTASNIVNDSLDFATMIYVPMARVDSRQLCQAGDIVIATSSGSSSVVGKSALVRQDLQVTFGAFCGLLRPMPSVDARFLAHIVQSRVVRSSWSALARGTNINNLKAAQITTTIIPLPPMSTQRQLADMLDEARGHVARLKQQLSVAMASGNALRRSILQAAFSGQLSRESNSV